MDNQKFATRKSVESNPAVLNSKEFEQDLELKRIKTKNEKLTFRIRLKALKRFALVALSLLLLWSATTETLFLFSGFYSITNSLLFTTLGIGVLVVLLEGGKFFFGTFALLFITQGWLKDGILYILTFLVLLPTTVGLFWGSYYMSVNGAPDIAIFVKAQTSSIQLVNSDSINQVYDTRVSQLQTKIDSAQNIKWRGTTTKTATKLSIAFQNQINQVEQQRQASLLSAVNTNTKTLEKMYKHTNNWGTWLSRFSGYGEILTIIFLLFLELYDRAAYLELPSKNKDKTNSNTDETTVVKQEIEDATTEDDELEELRDLIRTKKVDARYMKQRAKQCYKRSLKPKSAEEVKHRNLKRAELFITELASIGVETIISPNDKTELVFVEK